MSKTEHICGCYYSLPPPNSWSSPLRRYLQQVDVKTHTTILSTTSRTTLTQKFVVPSKTHGIRKLRYTFPLFDGVSVVAFKCSVGDRVITGEVKDKEGAKEQFKAAAERGEVAGLLEQLPDASDVFTTTIGNIAPDSTVVVDITYLGELKHDAEVDGVRFTIPTIISPRYGAYPGELIKSDAVGTTPGRFEVTVDTELEDGFFIREIRSPTHPIAVSMGALSTAPDAQPSMSKASASLGLGSAELDQDFVLQIISKEFGTPAAVLETHPTILGSRALMTTLVPKFNLKQARPEVVFVCDRSGSMTGGRIAALINALQTFLKSLPVGVVFNICSFGSSHDFLWPKSQPYNQQTTEQAFKHVKRFSANYGGTEIFCPLEATINNRFADRDLEVFLVTDGEVWNQQALFDMLNKRIAINREPVRVFTLGVGNSVSHSLIEGIARAGNGFSQAVRENEKLDAKVVRMLKASLFPQIRDFTLELKYDSSSDEDFEMLDPVDNSLETKAPLSDTKHDPKPIISLFDLNSNPDEPMDSSSTSEIPKYDIPMILQAPSQLPPLFPFNRTTAYILIAPDHQQRTLKAVVLRGYCPQGPLELEIPVTSLSEPGETIHQLAAKKAIQELEEGRGWLQTAKTCGATPGTTIKEQYPSMFGEIVKQECVRLGVQFQIANKYCSFVATEKKISEPENGQSFNEEDYEFLDLDESQLSLEKEENTGPSLRFRKAIPCMARSVPGALMPVHIHMACRKQRPRKESPKIGSPSIESYAAGLARASPFGSSTDWEPSDVNMQLQNTVRAPGTISSQSTFGGTTMHSRAAPCPPAPPNSLFVASRGAYTNSGSDRPLDYSLDMSEAASAPIEDDEDEDSEVHDSTESKKNITPSSKQTGVSLQSLIALQTFEGFWIWNEQLCHATGTDMTSAKKVTNLDKNVLATAIAIRVLETKWAAEKDTWELIVDKAKNWIENKVGLKGTEAVFRAAAKIAG
ncbi:hypothetical protein BT63DRAFT_430111 [Microthyrium microscopicum]|uniref:VIT-domain-containing protein n=1 Tax=Microthyrium microscopicum TaxID=703497 RepID=A0A6A6TWK6_9PEZI|nr:hypothetical protein BT63DRAFT_430111 [Microthyrium microscopicum]